MDRHPRFVMHFIGFSAFAVLVFPSASYAMHNAILPSETGNFYIEQSSLLALGSEPTRSKQHKVKGTSVGKPPAIKNVSPRKGETVTGMQTVISGTFDDAAGIGIDVKSVKMTLDGNDVTPNAIITPQFFAYRTDLRPGTYPVEVTGKDLAGNSVRHAWTFEVVSEESEAANALPLEILSHTDNAEVGVRVITVNGRTAPDARVDVQLEAFSALAGLGLTQQAVNQSTRADAAGNFSFNIESKVVVPGTRYEFTFVAVKDDLRRETKLILYQKK